MQPGLDGALSYFKANWFPLSSAFVPGLGVGWTHPPGAAPSCAVGLCWGCRRSGVPYGGRVVGERGLLCSHGHSHVVPDVSESTGWGFQVLLGLGPRVGNAP